MSEIEDFINEDQKDDFETLKTKVNDDPDISVQKIIEEVEKICTAE